MSDLKLYVAGSCSEDDWIDYTVHVCVTAQATHNVHSSMQKHDLDREERVPF